MEGEAGSCSSGLRPWPSTGAGTSRAKGLEVVTMKSRKAAAIEAWTASTRAFSSARQIAAEGRDHGAE